MEKIKSFIYLDENKMYSISSQLFEGLTEYILRDHSESSVEEDKQKGNFGSGRVMSEILQFERGSSEKRFLHDYAYNLFEKELFERNLLFYIEDSQNNIDLVDKQFVKIHGRAIFNDFKAMAETFRKFNDIGTAIGYIQTFDPKGNSLSNINAAIQNTKDRNQKNKVIQEKNKLNHTFKTFLLEAGLNINEVWLEHLQKLYEFGYKDQFTIRIPYTQQNMIFESILNRSFLKEDEISLITKYSRRTEIAFSIVGLLTQRGGEKIESPIEDIGSSMKRASLNFTNVISNLEETFNGRLTNEYIIDPIAIYREI